MENLCQKKNFSDKLELIDESFCLSCGNATHLFIQQSQCV